MHNLLRERSGTGKRSSEFGDELMIFKQTCARLGISFREYLNLETAIRKGKVMQSFDSDSNAYSKLSSYKWMLLAIALAMIAFNYTIPCSICQTGYLDPFYYTAYINNYVDHIEHYGRTYHSTRIAFIYPARFFNWLFGCGAGYIILRNIFLLCAIFSTHRICMRFYSSVKLSIFFSCFILFHPWLLRSLLWNYVDGFSIIYALISVSIFIAPNLKRTKISYFLSGVFLMLSLNCNPFVLIPLCACMLSWLIVRSKNQLFNEVSYSWKHNGWLILGLIVTELTMIGITYFEFPNQNPFFDFVTGHEIKQLVISPNGPMDSFTTLINNGKLQVFFPFVIFAAGLIYLWKRIPKMIQELVLGGFKAPKNDDRKCLCIINTEAFTKPDGRRFLAAFNPVQSRFLNHFRYQPQITKPNLAFGVLSILSLSFSFLFYIFAYFVFSQNFFGCFYYFSYLFVPVLLALIFLLGETLNDISKRAEKIILLIGAGLLGCTWIFPHPIAMRLLTKQMTYLCIGIGFLILLAIFKKLQVKKGQALLVIAIISLSPLFFYNKNIWGEYSVLQDRQRSSLEKDTYYGAIKVEEAIFDFLHKQPGKVGFWYAEESGHRYLHSVQSIFLGLASRLFFVNSGELGMPIIDDFFMSTYTKFDYIALLGINEQEIAFGYDALCKQEINTSIALKRNFTSKSAPIYLLLLKIEKK